LPRSRERENPLDTNPAARLARKNPQQSIQRRSSLGSPIWGKKKTRWVRVVKAIKERPGSKSNLRCKRKNRSREDTAERRNENYTGERRRASKGEQEITRYSGEGEGLAPVTAYKNQETGLSVGGPCQPGQQGRTDRSEGSLSGI